MPTVIVNDQEIEIGDDERLNGIEVARRAGAEIPHYCWHPGLSVVASCRMCLVETGQRDAETGEISMLPKLVPACQTPAKDGTVFVTESDKVKHARAFVEEALLVDHPIDCPICDKAGECSLQDYHFEHGQDERRADIKPFTSRRRPVGDTVTLFVDRCVMCSRCVRFTREVTGTSELMVVQRGAHEEIDVFPGYELANKMSGCVVDLCPVGALGDKDFLYQQRVWFMKQHESVCAGCSTGCSIFAEQNQDKLYRLKPRENTHINGWWMCDEGRYGYHHVHSDKRLSEPKRINRENGEAANVEWQEVTRDIAEDLAKVGHLAAVLSPHLSVEAAYLLGLFARSIDKNAVIALGHVPIVGEDELVGAGPLGRNFTIRAEKCPNRRGVEEVVAHFMGSVPTWDDVLADIDSGTVTAAWVSGGYKTDWNDAAVAERCAGLKLLVVQDLFDSPLMQAADYQLPGAAFAEHDGSYVNFADRLQSVRWAIRPPAGARAEAGLYWELVGRNGLYNARRVLDEVASEITYFNAASGEIPSVGVDLKVTLLADEPQTVEGGVG
ncbi:MAG: molybdopterin-dependent oxidoreductase [Pirellulales bacterium]|nr:molybdopterin-dependent oxidoreductase [Pirellulales bacterium]